MPAPFALGLMACSFSALTGDVDKTRRDRKVGEESPAPFSLGLIRREQPTSKFSLNGQDQVAIQSCSGSCCSISQVQLRAVALRV